VHLVGFYYKNCLVCLRIGIFYVFVRVNSVLGVPFVVICDHINEEAW